MTVVCPRHCIALFNRTQDSINLLQGFWQRDESLRQEDIQTLQRTLDSWYFGFGSPAVAGLLESVADDTGGTTLDTSMHGLIKEQLPDLIRISHTGPTLEIRSTAREIILDLKTKKGFRIPHIHVLSPSSMMTIDQIPHLEGIKDEPTEGEPFYTTYTLFREYWFQWGRLDNYIYLMGFHPEYLECFMKTLAHLFFADLPLPYPDRHYLALLAAANQRCVYLVLSFARQFIASGGDPTWLQGIQYAPLKWRQLTSLNRYLANQPWKVTAAHIHKLTHGGDTQSPGSTLSLSELMHAVAIMTHVHSLSSFIFGCGIGPEIDQYESLCNLMDLVLEKDGKGDERDPVDHSHEISTLTPKKLSPNGSKPVAQMRDVPSDPENQPSQPGESASQLLEVIQNQSHFQDDVTEDIVAELFTVVTKLNEDLDSKIDPVSLTRSSELLTSLNHHPAISRFVDDFDLGYASFEGQPFHVSEYCWQEEGYALADRLATDLGSLLDEKFRNTSDLTYNTLNSITNVDTTLYRRSVWNFTQSLFGICHDDFRYDCIEPFFDTPARVFLKLCATRPVMIDPINQRFENIFPMLSVSEVVHVILMVVEARQQACLLYALRAISECQAHRQY